MLMTDEEEDFKTPTFLRRLRHLRPELVPGPEAGLRLTEITCLMLGIDSRDQIPESRKTTRRARRSSQKYLHDCCLLFFS